MHYVGIDWGMEQHHVCVQTEDGLVITKAVISHDSKGFQELQSLLEALQPLKIVLERSENLLVDWLISHDWEVYHIHPTVSAHRRARRSKDDRGDAYLLSYLLRMGDKDCYPIPKQSGLAQQIKQAAIAYDQAKQDQRRFINRLMYVLRLYYPAIIQGFPTVYSLTCLAFLEAFPTPEAAKQLSMDELEAFLKEQRYSARAAILPRLYAALQQPMPTSRSPEAFALRMQTLIPVLRAMHYQRTSAEKHMTQLLKQHSDGDFWLGFPGSGPITAARLLAYIGDARERFPSAEVLQAIAGTVPITRRSGKQLRVAFRTACSHSLRAAIIDFSRSSIRSSGWARSYYNEQIARKHSASRAFRALANRWLAIMWKLWQTNEPYNEAIHVANRSRNRKPLPI